MRSRRIDISNVKNGDHVIVFTCRGQFYSRGIVYGKTVWHDEDIKGGDHSFRIKQDSDVVKEHGDVVPYSSSVLKDSIWLIYENPIS